MIIQQFIFSNKSSVRFLRHFVFWIVYITFFYLQSVTPEVVLLLYHSNAFYFGWVSVYCFLPACITSVYLFLYVLLPVYLQRKRYIPFAAAVVLLYVFFTVINYYMAKVFFNTSCNCDISKLGFLHIFGLGNNNAFLATSIGALATGIKFAKEWYLQRRHILELASENGKSALLYLKTRIPAQFLFQSLTSVEKSIANNAAEAPIMVLKLSEILSYMLYDCNPDFVPLTKELAAVKEYILLEQITANNSAAIELKTYGDVRDKAIVPAVLLSFLQNCFSLLSRKQMDAASIFTEIGTDDSKLYFLLSIHPCKENITAVDWNEVIADMQLKLNKFYLGKHHLEVSHTEEETLIEFSVILNKIAEPGVIEAEQILTHTYETV